MDVKAEAAMLAPTGPGGIKRGQTNVIKYLKRIRPWVNRTLVPYSQVGNAPVTSAHLFPWIAEIIRDLPAIQAEADTILLNRKAVPPFRDFAPGHERIVSEDDWRSFFFWGYGYPVPENLVRCPRTAQAVSKVPGLVSAIYSVVAPGAHIGRHRGVSKAIMTAHIGLRVPKEAEKCRMDVDGHEVVWRVGEAAVLDDTYPHEVWNETDETRVLLLIQFQRPMRQPGRFLASIVIWVVRRSSFVQRARKNLAHWEAAFAAAERA